MIAPTITISSTQSHTVIRILVHSPIEKEIEAVSTYDTVQMPVIRGAPGVDFDTLVRLAISQASQLSSRIVLLWVADVVLVIQPSMTVEEARAQFTVQSNWRQAAVHMGMLLT